jgi:hypothetical protein
MFARIGARPFSRYVAQVNGRRFTAAERHALAVWSGGYWAAPT